MLIETKHWNDQQTFLLRRARELLLWVSRSVYVSFHIIPQFNVFCVWPLGTKTWDWFSCLGHQSQEQSFSNLCSGEADQMSCKRDHFIPPFCSECISSFSCLTGNLFKNFFRTQLELTNTRKLLLISLPSPGRRICIPDSTLTFLREP